MTVTEKIETMNKQEFQDLFFYILQIATTKYNISFSQKDTMIDNNITQKYMASNFNKPLEGFENIKKEKPVFGCMKGMVKYMADDFDAPLDDLKDYMY